MLLKATFSMFELVHVPREQNYRANLLSKLASSRKEGRQRSVIQETLKSPRTAEGGPAQVSHVEILGVSPRKERRHWSLTQETLKVPRVTTYGLLGDEFLEVLQVDTTEMWITPYQRYLTDWLLPAKPTEAKAFSSNEGKYTLIDGKLFCHGYTHPILTCISRDQCTRIVEGRLTWVLLADYGGGLCEVWSTLRATSEAC